MVSGWSRRSGFRSRHDDRRGRRDVEARWTMPIREKKDGHDERPRSEERRSRPNAKLKRSRCQSSAKTHVASGPRLCRQRRRTRDITSSYRHVPLLFSGRRARLCPFLLYADAVRSACQTSLAPLDLLLSSKSSAIAPSFTMVRFLVVRKSVRRHDRRRRRRWRRWRWRGGPLRVASAAALTSASAETQLSLL